MSMIQDDLGLNCTGGVAWILKALDQCVVNDLQYASVIVGLISLSFWIFVLFPQLWENYKTGNCEGLSSYFIASWILGDSTNLLGCIYTQQLPLQIWNGIYYICADLILTLQYAYYKIKVRRKKGGLPSPRKACMVLMTLFLSTGGFFLSRPSEDKFLIEHRTGRVLLGIPFFKGTGDIAGFIFGWISGLFYLTARIPQMIKNCKRQSTEGISKGLFIMALLGNLTYGVAVLLESQEIEHIIRSLPWLFGSLGCVMVDSLMFYQFYAYGSKSKLYMMVSDQDPEVGIQNSINTDIDITPLMHGEDLPAEYDSPFD